MYLESSGVVCLSTHSEAILILVTNSPPSKIRPPPFLPFISVHHVHVWGHGDNLLADCGPIEPSLQPLPGCRRLGTISGARISGKPRNIKIEVLADLFEKTSPIPFFRTKLLFYSVFLV